MEFSDFICMEYTFMDWLGFCKWTQILIHNNVFFFTFFLSYFELLYPAYVFSVFFSMYAPLEHCSSIFFKHFRQIRVKNMRASFQFNLFLVILSQKKVLPSITCKNKGMHEVTKIRICDPYRTHSRVI